MPRTPRLKVYVAAAGFTEAVVAAPSQKAALEAWGARDDYFAHGIARVVDDPETVAAATAQPGVVLKRPIGTAEALVAAAKPPPRAAPKAPAESEAAPKAKAEAATPTPKAEPKPPPPDRGPLTAAEAALKTAQRARRDLEREQAREREDLDRPQDKAREAAEAQVDALAKARDRAQTAYDKAR